MNAWYRRKREPYPVPQWEIQAFSAAEWKQVPGYGQAARVNLQVAVKVGDQVCMDGELFWVTDVLLLVEGASGPAERWTTPSCHCRWLVLAEL